MHAFRELLALSFWLIFIGLLVLQGGERVGGGLFLIVGICLLPLVLLALWKGRRQPYPWARGP
jgi:hypothetical protein